MRQPKVMCGAGYKPPVSDGMRLHFRPAEFGHGSELDVMYEHDANESPGCCKKKNENEWVFKSPGRENLTFRMLPEIETGPIWQLFKGSLKLPPLMFQRQSNWRPIVSAHLEANFHSAAARKWRQSNPWCGCE